MKNAESRPRCWLASAELTPRVASRSSAGRQGAAARASSRPGSVPRPAPALTCLSALGPPRGFGQGCARLSAPALGSSWGWRRPGGEPGVSLRVRGLLPSAHDPPAFALPGLCKPPRWGASGRFLRGWGIGVEKPPHPNPRNKPGVPWDPVPLAGPGEPGPPPGCSGRGGSARMLVAAERPASRRE